MSSPKVAIQALKRTVTVAWPEMHKEAAKDILVATARSGHAQIMADAKKDGAVPTFMAYANRPGNTNLDSVNLPGPIVFQYFYGREIVEFVFRELVAASPVHSGRYRDSHMLFIDGLPAKAIPTSFSFRDEIMIANPVPYARRLEIGKTNSGRDFLVSVPNRIYERIAKKAKARYGNMAKITFDYATLPSSYRLVKDNPARSWLPNKQKWYHAPKQRKDRVAGAPVRSPCIVIEAYR